MEKHINKHLSKHLETYDFHHTNQSDSGKTFHAKLLSLVLLINGYTMSMRTNSQVHWFFVCLFVCLFCFCFYFVAVVVVFDFTRAFGIIDLDLLYRKLLLYGVSDQCHQQTTSILTNQNQVVCMDRSKSNMQEMKYGVPILFSVYVNALPLYIPEELCEPFCDDAIIHTSHHNLFSVFKSLQNCINKLTTWSHFKHMSLNPHKNKLKIKH